MELYRFQELCKEFRGLERVVSRTCGRFPRIWGGTREGQLRFLTVKRLSSFDLLHYFEMLQCGEYDRPTLWLYYEKRGPFGLFKTRRIVRIARFDSLVERREKYANNPTLITAPQYCHNLAETIDKKGLIPSSWFHVFEVHSSVDAAIRVLKLPDSGLEFIIERHRQDLRKEAEERQE